MIFILRKLQIFLWSSVCVNCVCFHSLVIDLDHSTLSADHTNIHLAIRDYYCFTKMWKFVEIRFLVFKEFILTFILYFNCFFLSTTDSLKILFRQYIAVFRQFINCDSKIMTLQYELCFMNSNTLFLTCFPTNLMQGF